MDMLTVDQAIIKLLEAKEKMGGNIPLVFSVPERGLLFKLNDIVANEDWQLVEITTKSPEI